MVSGLGVPFDPRGGGTISESWRANAALIAAISAGFWFMSGRNLLRPYT